MLLFGVLRFLILGCCDCATGQCWISALCPPLEPSKWVTALKNVPLSRAKSTDLQLPRLSEWLKQTREAQLHCGSLP